MYPLVICLNVADIPLFLAALKTSTILYDFGNPTYVHDLTQFLEPVLQKYSSYTWTRCYHALSDGWETSTFHSLCDDQGSTLAIVRVNNYIFGGFTSISWGGKHTIAHSRI